MLATSTHVVDVVVAGAFVLGSVVGILVVVVGAFVVVVGAFVVALVVDELPHRPQVLSQ